MQGNQHRECLTPNLHILQCTYVPLNDTLVSSFRMPRCVLQSADDGPNLRICCSFSLTLRHKYIYFPNR